jgi:hypothetical protein
MFTPHYRIPLSYLHLEYIYIYSLSMDNLSLILNAFRTIYHPLLTLIRCYSLLAMLENTIAILHTSTLYYTLHYMILYIYNLPSMRFLCPPHPSLLYYIPHCELYSHLLTCRTIVILHKNIPAFAFFISVCMSFGLLRSFVS